MLDRLELAVLAPRDEDQVDQANDVVLAKPTKLGEDLAGELPVLETNNQELYRTEFHLDQLLLLGFELLVGEDAGVVQIAELLERIDAVHLRHPSAA